MTKIILMSEHLKTCWEVVLRGYKQWTIHPQEHKVSYIIDSNEWASQIYLTKNINFL